MAQVGIGMPEAGPREGLVARARERCVRGCLMRARSIPVGADAMRYSLMRDGVAREEWHVEAWCERLRFEPVSLGMAQYDMVRLGTSAVHTSRCGTT